MAVPTSEARGASATDWLRLLRPKQWSKNVFVFAALIFTQGWRDAGAMQAAFAAYVTMCLVSSATYIANDLMDLAADQAHPQKRSRPIASGRIPAPTAMVFAFVLATAGLAVAFSFGFYKPVVLYLLLQAAYNLRLKHEAVADVATIASGFVLRVVAGASAIHAPVSAWILLCTGFLALLLGFGKRRHEFRLMGDEAHSTRAALAGYSSASLDMLLGFSAACAVLSYGVYSIESRTAREHPGLFLTTPFVVYGVARYLTILYVGGEGGEPESLVLKDVQLIFVFIGFLVAAVAALSGFHPGIVK